MSVSKKILQEAHIALLDNGQIALVDNTKTGILRIHRVITREEIIASAEMLYMQFKNDNPDIQVLQVPFGEEKIFAMTMLDKPKE